MTVEEYLVETYPESGRRVDSWLATKSPLSRSRIQALFEEGNISRNGKPLKSLSWRVSKGDRYTILVPDTESTELVAQDIPLDIVFEDEHILVVNKAAGMVVHPAPGHSDGTLVNAVLFHCPGVLSIGGEERPGIVHRLDQDTSGLIVVAKTDKAMIALSDAFKDGAVHKTYNAIVHGVPRPVAGRIETQIGRNPQDRKKMCVLPTGGRNAITEFETLRDFGVASLVKVNIETGRTHQIRVHMNYLGNPVVGDKVYGSMRRDMKLPMTVDRQLLHAAHIEFYHPVKKRTLLKLDAPLPKDFEDMLNALSGKR